MSIADGRKIAIRFTQPLVGDVTTGNEDKFTISFDEYSYVPGGTLSRVTRAVASIEVADSQTILLNFDPGCTNSIQRAVGNIMVAYNGSGTLMGQGGPVLAFEKTFTPVDLDPKNNPHGMEFISLLDIQAGGSLQKVNLEGAYNQNHIEIMGITASSDLIHIDDL